MERRRNYILKGYSVSVQKDKNVLQTVVIVTQHSEISQNCIHLEAAKTFIPLDIVCYNLTKNLAEHRAWWLLISEPKKCRQEDLGSWRERGERRRERERIGSI